MFYCKSLCKFTFSSGLNELKKWEVILTTIPYSCVLHLKEGCLKVILLKHLTVNYLSINAILVYGSD